MKSLRDVVLGLGYAPDSEWGWHNYKRTVEAFISTCGFSRVLEIGGGRSPLFTADDARRLGIDYTVNDIARQELELGPDCVSKSCFDIAGPGLRVAERYDLVFSRMVFEHLADSETAYRNMHTLLRDGGVAIIFYPTLFSPPFVINRLLPEWLSSFVVKWAFSSRNEEGVPKLPAYYSWCYGGDSRMSRMLRAAGYSDYVILPFYGHTYFEKFPVLRSLDRRLSQAARLRGWRFLSSYAYCIVRR